MAYTIIQQIDKEVSEVSWKQEKTSSNFADASESYLWNHVLKNQDMSTAKYTCLDICLDVLGL